MRFWKRRIGRVKFRTIFLIYFSVYKHHKEDHPDLLSYLFVFIYDDRDIFGQLILWTINKRDDIIYYLIIYIFNHILVLSYHYFFILILKSKYWIIRVLYVVNFVYSRHHPPTCNCGKDADARWSHVRRTKWITLTFHE